MKTDSFKSPNEFDPSAEFTSLPGFGKIVIFDDRYDSYATISFEGMDALIKWYEDLKVEHFRNLRFLQTTQHPIGTNT